MFNHSVEQGKPSIRPVHPPGGSSSNIFAPDNSVPARRANAPGGNSAMGSILSSAPSNQAAPAQEYQRVPPGGHSNIFSHDPVANYSSPTRQPPGGKSSVFSANESYPTDLAVSPRRAPPGGSTSINLAFDPNASSPNQRRVSLTSGGGTSSVSFGDDGGGMGVANVGQPDSVRPVSYTPVAPPGGHQTFAFGDAPSAVSPGTQSQRVPPGGHTSNIFTPAGPSNVNPRLGAGLSSGVSSSLQYNESAAPANAHVPARPQPPGGKSSNIFG